VVELTQTQREVLRAVGTSSSPAGPARGRRRLDPQGCKIAREELKPGQRILFLSFARATVSRVLEANRRGSAITRESGSGSRSIPTIRSSGASQDTRLSYRLSAADDDPYAPNEAIALSAVRSGYKTLPSYRRRKRRRSARGRKQNAIAWRLRRKGLLRPLATACDPAPWLQQGPVAHLDDVSLHHPG